MRNLGGIVSEEFSLSQKFSWRPIYPTLSHDFFSHAQAELPVSVLWRSGPFLFDPKSNHLAPAPGTSTLSGDDGLWCSLDRNSYPHGCNFSSCILSLVIFFYLWTYSLIIKTPLIYMTSHPGPRLNSGIFYTTRYTLLAEVTLEYSGLGVGRSGRENLL